MNYKHALVALAATVTLGLSPALSSNVHAATPKATSSYWSKKNTVYSVKIKKNVKAIKATYVTGKGLNLTKKTVTLKKGRIVTLLKNNNGDWVCITSGKNNESNYYIVTDSNLVKSTSWFKLQKAIKTNSSSSSNSNNSSNKNSSSNSSSSSKKTNTVTTVNSAYKTAQSSVPSSTDFQDAFVSPNSNAANINGTTITPGNKYSVKLIDMGGSAVYQIKLSDNNIVTVPYSNTSDNTFVFLTTNVYNYGNDGNTFISAYSPDSSDAVVSSSFKPTSGTIWYTTSNINSSQVTPTGAYVYNAQSNNWSKVK
ncbi:hypothetical protein [Nicoliella lavandulae]|uniref:Surface layer protein A domain-containing protein n=1 Tax=Nicoliella lavandulae TaxID=3082954 RepID=A0ABU8SIZ0_9LACO